ncbi:hypothetical protein Acr_28g0002190 [Actinidia rufa]|uniref:Uncharacterized protein n=1 Tax=Actinidia rufa TaxID=165716 RepID=A0A7J0H9V2_9ERIC|nr:hypothetical protein Acr_28g0002190 [Actinidia rufa]
MHFQIEVLAPSYVGAMQPPTGVQKRERVLCLPLARSALPCRLTRHSALGTVRLCPVGLARHSTPGMVLVIKCNSLAAKYCHYVRALLGWLCTVGSARLALHGWLCSIGSARLALPLCTGQVIKIKFGTAQCSTEAARCNSRVAHQIAVRNCPNVALNAARCNLRVSRISFKHVYELTVGAIKYGMQDICIKQVRAHGCSKQVPNAANYCCQTYAVLGMLRQTQLSAYCQNICSSRNTATNAALGILPDICSSRNTATHAALGILPDICSSRNTATHAALSILPESPPCAHHWRDHCY